VSDGAPTPHRPRSISLRGSGCILIGSLRMGRPECVRLRTARFQERAVDRRDGPMLAGPRRSPPKLYRHFCGSQWRPRPPCARGASCAPFPPLPPSFARDPASPSKWVDHPLLIVPRSARQREVASGFLDLDRLGGAPGLVAPLIARTAAVGVVAFVGRMDLSHRGQVQSWGDAFAQRILPVRQSVRHLSLHRGAAIGSVVALRCSVWTGRTAVKSTA